MTLNELVQDVLLEARNNQITESEKLSRHQIEIWIKSYRAMLIKQDIDKGRTVNPLYTQTIKMHLDKVEEETGHLEYIGDKELPTLIDFNFRPGVVSVKDMFGNLIQLGSETKMKLQRYRKYTCKDYIAYVKGNRIYVEGDANQLEYIEVEIIAEDPTDLKLCYNPETDEYPLPAAMWGTIKDMIFAKDFRTMSMQPSDTTYDSKDDLQNVYNPNVNRRVRR